MPFPKIVSRLLSLALGALMAVPIYALSGSALLAFFVACSTYLILELILVQQFSPKAKLVLLFIYIISMIAVIAMIFTMR